MTGVTLNTEYPTEAASLLGLSYCLHITLELGEQTLQNRLDREKLSHIQLI